MIIIDSVDRKEVEIDENRSAVSSGISVQVKGVHPTEALFQLMHALHELSELFPKMHSEDCDEKDCPPMKLAAMINRSTKELEEEIKTFQALEHINYNKHK